MRNIRKPRWPAWIAASLSLAATAFAGYWVVVFANAHGHPPGIVFIPFMVGGWLIGMLLIALLWWLLRRLARPRRSIPLCRGCGYDLRGSIDALIERCPECGAIIVAEQTDTWRSQQRPEVS